MVWAVDKWADALKEKRGREKDIIGQPVYHYFETREEACQFIVSRAEKKVTDAEQALKKAREHHRKCIKKYL